MIYLLVVERTFARWHSACWCWVSPPVSIKWKCLVSVILNVQVTVTGVYLHPVKYRNDKHTHTIVTFARRDVIALLGFVFHLHFSRKWCPHHVKTCYGARWDTIRFAKIRCVALRVHDGLAIWGGGHMGVAFAVVPIHQFLFNVCALIHHM